MWSEFESPVIKTVLVSLFFWGAGLFAGNDLANPVLRELDQRFQQMVETDFKYNDHLFHFFKKKNVNLDGKGSIAEQIDRHERKKREGYSFDSKEGLGVFIQPPKLLSKHWKKSFSSELFSLEGGSHWGSGGIPFFCFAFKTFPRQMVAAAKGKASQALRTASRCKKLLHQLLAPLPIQARALPVYLVTFKANYFGVLKYVKLYLGHRCAQGKVTNQFTVLDLIVYDNPYKLGFSPYLK